MFKIEIDSKHSVNNLIKTFKKIKGKLYLINKEFIAKSIDWIIHKANENIKESSNFEGTTDIDKSWQIVKTVSSNTIESYMIKNNSPFSALVEFGTGIVGKSHPHKYARIAGYKYGNKEWDFIRDLETNEWVQHPFEVYNKNEALDNPDRYLYIEDFAGYEGKSYLYNAVFDYFNLNEYIFIYESLWKDYII